MLRSLAVIVGCAIVLTTAHISIMASGGYGGPTAPLQIAVALGLCTGSVCVGACLGDRRWLLAAVFIVALLSGETYTILISSEVTLSARDAATAPLVEQAAKRTAALEELAAAETALPAPADSSRLQAAEKAQAAAEIAVRDKAADKGCRENCRMLLQSAVDTAQREVAAARAEFDRKTSTESQRFDDRRRAARAAVASLPPARSATPLADRLGVPGWALDLLMAALRSIAANGSGAALIAFGAHGQSRTEEQRTIGAHAAARGIAAAAHHSASGDIEVASIPALPAPSARDHAVRFSRDILEPSETDTPVANLHPTYIQWCQSNGQTPFPARMIGAELVELFKRARIDILDIDGTKYLVCARLKAVAPALE